MKYRIVLFSLIFLVNIVAAQNEVQQLFPCIDTTGTAVPGCIAISLGSGQYAEAVKDTSYCSGNDLVVKYIAANSFLNITEGDSIWQDTFLNACNIQIDSTRLLQDSITVYYSNGSEIGRDTIRLDGGSDGNGIYDGSGTVPTSTVATLTDRITFDNGDEDIEFDLSGSNPVINLFDNNNPNGDGYIYSHGTSGDKKAELRLGQNSSWSNRNGLFTFMDLENNSDVELRLNTNSYNTEINFGFQFSIISDFNNSQAKLYSNSLSSNVQEWDLTAGDIFFPQYNGLDKVVTNQTNKYVALIDTTGGQLFLIHPDSIGGAGGGGGADGNDFVTDLSITSGASGDATRTLQATIPNQTNQSVVINISDADSSTTNEIQTLSIDSTASNGTFRTFTVSLTDGGSVSFRDSIGSTGGGTGTDDQTISLDSTANTYSLSIESGNTVNWIKSSDDQDISTTGAAGNITIEDGNTLNLNVDDADASATNEGSLSVGAGTATTSIIQSNTSGSNQVFLKEGNNITLSESGDTITITSAGGGAGDGFIIPDSLVNITSGSTERITFHYTDEVGNQDSIFTTFTDDTGGGGGSDGNDFVTSISETEPTDSTLRLELNIPNQSDPSVTFVINDNDADPSNEGSLTVAAGTTSNSIIQSNTSGSTDVTITGGTGVNITESGNEIILSAVDNSQFNEGSLTVGAGTATTSLIQSNTGASTDVTLEAGSNITLSEASNTITIAATGDGTGTDDQTISTTGAAGNISIESGNTLNLNVDDADASTTNEIQDLSAAVQYSNGAELRISGGGDNIDFLADDGLEITISGGDMRWGIVQDSLDSWGSSGTGDPDQVFNVSTVGSDVRLGLSPYNSDQNMDFRGGTGIDVSIVSPGDVMEISFNNPIKDTIYISLTHTSWNDTINNAYSDDFFQVPPSMNGWRIKEASYRTFENADQDITVSYSILTSAGAETTNIIDILNGTKSITETFSFGNTLTTDDVIRVNCTDTGTNTKGLTMTLMISEP